MKAKTKKNNNYICYTGYDAQKKGPTHTQKEFMKIMNKKSKISWKNKFSSAKLCSEYLASKKCNFCKKYKRSIRHTIIKSKNNSAYKISEKQDKKQDKLSMKCDSCKQRGTEPCNLEDFLKYSGATKGKCKISDNN